MLFKQGVTSLVFQFKKFRVVRVTQKKLKQEIDF